MNVQNLVLEMAGTIVSLKDLRKLAWVTVKQLMQFVSIQLKERESNECMIYDVLHVPKLACNLFSARAAASKGKSVKFSDDKCWIYSYNRAGNVCGTSSLVNKLYQLDCKPLSSEQSVK